MSSLSDPSVALLRGLTIRQSIFRSINRPLTHSPTQSSRRPIAHSLTQSIKHTISHSLNQAFTQAITPFRQSVPLHGPLHPTVGAAKWTAQSKLATLSQALSRSPSSQSSPHSPKLFHALKARHTLPSSFTLSKPGELFIMRASRS